MLANISFAAGSGVEAAQRPNSSKHRRFAQISWPSTRADAPNVNPGAACGSGLIRATDW
jgi:hypothetical protein